MTTNVARRESAGAAVDAGKYTLKTIIETRRDEFASALAGRVDPDAFVRVAYTTITKSPKLAEATAPSILMALLECASLGLIPNGVMGEAYLVPFNNKVKVPGGGERCEVQAQFIPGYRGLIKLARRSGVVRNIVPGVIREGDTWEQKQGLHPDLVHTPNPDVDDSDPTLITHVYAVAWFADDTQPQFMVMSRAVVEKIRLRSNSKDSGPWITDWEAMAIKTVIRRLFKYVPASDFDLTAALEADNRDFRDFSDVGTDAAGVTVRALPQSRASALAGRLGATTPDAYDATAPTAVSELDAAGLHGEVPSAPAPPAPSPPPAPAAGESGDMASFLALVRTAVVKPGRGEAAARDAQREKAADLRAPDLQRLRSGGREVVRAGQRRGPLRHARGPAVAEGARRAGRRHPRHPRGGLTMPCDSDFLRGMMIGAALAAPIALMLRAAVAATRPTVTMRSMQAEASERRRLSAERWATPEAALDRIRKAGY